MPGTEATNLKDREYHITDPTVLTGACGVVQRAVRRSNEQKVVIKMFKKGISLVEVIKAWWTPPQIQHAGKFSHPTGSRNARIAKIPRNKPVSNRGPGPLALARPTGFLRIVSDNSRADFVET